MTGLPGGRITSPVTARSGSLPAPPAGWRWAPLGKVARLETGHTPSRRHPEYWDGDVPWLSLKDIRSLGGNYIEETADKPTMLGIDNSSARILPKGTVALCRTASVGKAVILGRDMATSQDFVDWVCGPELLPEYLLHALRASGAAFATEKQGTTHKTIYMPVLTRLWVLLPPIQEQRRIAAILDKADAILRKRQEALRLTDDLLRSAFVDMFGDPVTNPRRWTETRLDQVAQIKSGVTKGRHLDPASVVSLPYMRVANVQDGHIDIDDVKEIELLASEAEEFQLRSGDVLLTEGGDPDKLGRGAVWRCQVDPCVYQNHIFRLRPDNSAVLPDFLSTLLGSQRGKGYFLRAAKQTTGIASINRTQLSGFPVLLPPVATQERFSLVVAGTAVLKPRGRARSADAEGLFESLLQHAFRGQLEVMA